MTETKSGAKTILCAGGAVQDIVMRVERFPAAGMKAQASDSVVVTGGQGGNAAVTVARLGARSRYAGPIGGPDDKVAEEIAAALTNEGIDCRHLLRVPGGRSSMSVIMIDRDGEKLIATRRGAGLSDAVPRDAEAAVEGIDAVLLDNRYANFMMPILRAAIARGIPRVLDLDQATGPSDAPLIAGATHVIASIEAMRGISGATEPQDGVLRLAPDHAGLVAVTNGPDGVYWRDGGAVRHMPAFEIEAVDTLGAGDAFHGAFTLRIAETGDVVQSLRFASAVAALKCTRFGGTAGAPTRSEVEEFLAARR